MLFAYHNMMIKFKIDLIVWKYTSKAEKWDLKSQFKIDLIVWKYGFAKTTNDAFV